MLRHTIRPAAAAGILLFAAACGSGSAASPEAPASDAGTSPATVEVRNIAFKPAALEVAAGTEVTWTSFDAGVAHTVTSGTPGDVGVPGVSDAAESAPDGAFDGPLDDAGSEFRFTFDDPGTYAYFCEIHPSMTGEVVVS